MSIDHTINIRAIAILYHVRLIAYNKKLSTSPRLERPS
jgi:hypothetical protein